MRSVELTEFTSGVLCHHSTYLDPVVNLLNTCKVNKQMFFALSLVTPFFLVYRLCINICTKENTGNGPKKWEFGL